MTVRHVGFKAIAVGLAVAGLMLGVLAGFSRAAGPLGAPTAADAAVTAAQEFKTLPSGALEIPCTPAMTTFPPFTRFTGFSGGFYVLADGRCFVNPAARPPIVIPVVTSAP